MTDKETFLQQHPIFANLDDDEMEALAEISTEMAYEDGRPVAYQGDVADCLTIVRSGRLYAETRVDSEYEGQSYVTHSHNYLPGQYFDDSWLFAPSAHPATVKATAHGSQPARVIVIKSSQFLRFLNQFPDALGKLAPAQDSDGGHIGLSPHAWDEAQKLLAKADRKSAAVSVLPDELIEYNSRRSRWFLLVRMFVPVLGLVTLPTLLYLFFIGQPAGAFLYRLRFVVPGFFALFFFGFALFRLLDWSNDYFIITNRRLVHREFDLRTFRIDIKTARINQIQSVEIAKPTLLTNLFNIGTARITTASQFGMILFENIDDPISVKQTLDRLSQRVRTMDASKEQTLMRQSLEGHFNVSPVHQTIEEAEQEDEEPALFETEETAWIRFVRRYRWRDEQDNVIRYRKHVMVLIFESIIPLSLLVLGVLLAWVLVRFFAFTPAELALILTLYFFADALWLIWRIEDWRNDMFQLTDRLIIDIDRRPFGFGESRKQALLSNIQNVNAYTPNLLHTIFNYGNVEVETAGEESNIVFENVPFPSVVQSDIFQRLEDFQEAQRQRLQAQRHKEYSLLLDVFKQTEEQQRIPRRTPGDIPPFES